MTSFNNKKYKAMQATYSRCIRCTSNVTHGEHFKFLIYML